MGVYTKLIEKFCKMIEKGDNARIAAQSPPDGVETIELSYADYDKLYNKFDIYYPTGSEDKVLPTIVDVHGGCWFYGTKDINKYYCMEIAKKGYKVVSISYRLLFKGGRFPNNIIDIFSAYNWIEKNADKYKLDLNNIYLTGDSAGAHLAAMSFGIMKDDKLSEKLNLKSSLDFKALGFTCGVFDIDFYRKRVNISMVRFLLKEFFGKKYRKNEFLRFATIKNFDLEKFPPIFLSTGKGDFMHSQVIRFAKVLSKRGLEYALVDIHNPKNKLMHVYPIIQPHYEESIFATDSMLEFFDSYAK